MLRPWNFPRQFATDFVEHECPRCGREVELPIGHLCDACRLAIRRRARRWALIVSAASTAIVAWYVRSRTPVDPGTFRVVGTVAVVVWFALMYQVVYRVMSEWQR